MPSLDGLDVTTLTVVKIYRFAVAAKKKRIQLKVAIGGSAIFEPPIPITLVVTHLFCSTLCRDATQKSNVKYVFSNALLFEKPAQDQHRQQCAATPQ
jgi:hypothetical protein